MTKTRRLKNFAIVFQSHVKNELWKGKIIFFIV